MATKSELRGKYNRAKKKYHLLGNALSKNPNDAEIRRRYNEAKKRYHKFGEQLSKA